MQRIHMLSREKHVVDMKSSGKSSDRKKPTTELDKQRSQKLLRKYNERRVEEPELTQKIVAEDCGMSESTVSRMLSGDLAISAGAALQLARRLFCHPGEFHEDFIDFTAAESSQNAKALYQMEKLSEEDQALVRNFVSSLSEKNRDDR